MTQRGLNIISWCAPITMVFSFVVSDFVSNDTSRILYVIAGAAAILACYANIQWINLEEQRVKDYHKQRKDRQNARRD